MPELVGDAQPRCSINLPRDRLADYQTGTDVDTQCAADQMSTSDLAASAAGRLVGTELVWIEGDLRAKGQVRLWGTRLELRDSTGST